MSSVGRSTAGSFSAYSTATSGSSDVVSLEASSSESADVPAYTGDDTVRMDRLANLTVEEDSDEASVLHKYDAESQDDYTGNIATATTTNTDSVRFGHHPRTSTLDGISRLETMDTNPFLGLGERYSAGQQSSAENEAIEIHRTNDKIPSVKPAVDYQDKLWTPIDILDDVHKLSEKVHANKSFFDLKHAESLEALKRSQLKLLSTMAEAEKMMSVNDYYTIWRPLTGTDSQGGDDPHLESENDEDVPNLKEYKTGLFDNSFFVELGNLTQQVRENLQDVKQSIIRIDQLSRERNTGD